MKEITSKRETLQEVLVRDRNHLQKQ